MSSYCYSNLLLELIYSWGNFILLVGAEKKNQEVFLFASFYYFFLIGTFSQSKLQRVSKPSSRSSRVRSKMLLSHTEAQWHSINCVPLNFSKEEG